MAELHRFTDAGVSGNVCERVCVCVFMKKMESVIYATCSCFILFDII